MKVLNFTASAVLVTLVFYLLVVGESLLLPLVIAIALWYLINTLARGFNRIEVARFQVSDACLPGGVITDFSAVDMGAGQFSQCLG
jgi:hypothetical protein